VGDEYIKQLEDQLDKIASELEDAQRYEDAVEKIVQYLERKVIKSKQRDEFGYTTSHVGCDSTTLKDILIIIDEIVSGNKIRDTHK